MSKAIIFKGLNEVRALAALAVLVHHVELYKFKQGIPSLIELKELNYFIRHLGINGVFVFFTLSGFLITYLLLEELQTSGNISIRNFYMRRVLRIWPLYYLIIMIGFFLLPFLLQTFPAFFESQHFYNERIRHLVYGNNLILHLTFLTNVAFGGFNHVAGASQSWSVCVEEQFYLIWPWIVLLARKYLIQVLILIILIMGFLHLPQKPIHWVVQNNYLDTFLKYFNIDYMAIGGILAYFYKYHFSSLVRVLRLPLFRLFILAASVYFLCFDGFDIFRAFFFALLILTLIELGFSVKWLNSLGKISYGIYMFHPFAMYISFATIHNLGFKQVYINQILAYVFVCGITWALSMASYTWIELPMLRLKSRFTQVHSGTI